jgi:hypothetical protein
MLIGIASALLLWVLLGAVVAALTGQLHVRRWLHQAFLAVDQLCNVLATPMHGGAWADETLSARAYRAHSAGRLWGRVCMPVIDLLFMWQGPRHCERAYIAERERLHAPPEAR